MMPTIIFIIGERDNNSTSGKIRSIIPINLIFAGTIPSPILFGAIIDKSCLLWEDNCGDTGSCYFYDNFDQSISLMALALCFKASSFIFFTLSLCLYRPPEVVDDETPELSTASLQMTELSKGSSMNSLPPYQTGMSNPVLSTDEETGS